MIVGWHSDTEIETAGMPIFHIFLFSFLSDSFVPTIFSSILRDECEKNQWKIDMIMIEHPYAISQKYFQDGIINIAHCCHRHH